MCADAVQSLMAEGCAAVQECDANAAGKRDTARHKNQSFID